MTESTAPKPFVFVLMPFNKDFDDIYKKGIKVACQEAGAYCERVDEQLFSESILERIYNQIAKADLIISDMTGRNPNVFYETGYAHALDKQVIHLTQESNDIPFDMQHYPHIIYGGSVAKLKRELKRRVEWAVENPNIRVEQVSFDLDSYVNNIKLGNNPTIAISEAKERRGEISGGSYKGYYELIFALHNSGKRTRNVSQYKFGIIPVAFDGYINRGPSSPELLFTTIEGGKMMYRLDWIKGLSPEMLFSDEWLSQRMYLRPSEDMVAKKSNPCEFCIRVFTQFGIIDFPFSISIKYGV